MGCWALRISIILLEQGAPGNDRVGTTARDVFRSTPSHRSWRRAVLPPEPRPPVLGESKRAAAGYRAAAMMCRSMWIKKEVR